MIFGNAEFITSFLSSLIAAGQLGTAGQCSVQLYQGAIPTDSAAVSFDPTTRSSDLVATFTNLTFSLVGNALAVNQLPSAASCSKTTTVTWGYIKGQNGVGLILEASLTGGTGALLLDKVAVTNGGNVSMVDAGVSLTFFQ